jgi:hypothetical protein
MAYSRIADRRPAVRDRWKIGQIDDRRSHPADFSANDDRLVLTLS